MKTRTKQTPNYVKVVLFWGVTLILVAITVFCIRGIVYSQSDIPETELEKYYRTVEQELLAETRNELNELGYLNSGVTLTHVVDEEGRREYTFTIHHAKIDKMCEEDRRELADQLLYRVEEKMQLIENAIFFHEFLMYD